MCLERPQVTSRFSECTIAFLKVTLFLPSPLFKIVQLPYPCSVQDDCLLSHPLASHHLCPSSPRPATGRLPGRGEPLRRDGLQLSGTRDKHPLDIPAHRCDSSITVQGGKCMVSSLHAQAQCYFRFIALLVRVPGVCLCFAHTPATCC